MATGKTLKHGFSNECFVLDEHDQVCTKTYSITTFSDKNDRAQMFNFHICQVDLSKKKLLILIVSNTGDGDPLDSTTKFFIFLREIKSNTF
ncbi:7439_t:CDS:2 [Acaulospora colombiana]|uniref:7439_t:CDS:1 n=1 Tax=Acaulospora colombiana TaxID=27376 RepID=A0ACA9KWG5_9GLOM|nr:7439_t:CDS:2 [Acaulospora colombiana]